MTELGMPNFGPSFKVSCENHGGPGFGCVTSNGMPLRATFKLITDYIGQSDQDVIMPLIDGRQRRPLPRKTTSSRAAVQRRSRSPHLPRPAEKFGGRGALEPANHVSLATQRRAPMLDAWKTRRPCLEVNNIEVIYNHVILVLKGVSLSVPKGRDHRAAGRQWRGQDHDAEGDIRTCCIPSVARSPRARSPIVASGCRIWTRRIWSRRA